MKNYKKALFIYNPNSGNREMASEMDEIIARFIENDIILTIIRLDEDVYEEIGNILNTFEYDFIIGSGGDGTIKAIGSQIIKNNIQKPYAVIGSGTCNNFAANIQMPIGDLYKTIDEICKLETKVVDAGQLETGDTFLSSLAVGVFADTSFETNSDLKGWLGPLAYYLQGITKLSNIKAHKFTIKTDKEVIEQMAYLVLVINGTHVGSFKGILEDDVDIQDGIFELIVIKETNPVDIANLLVMTAKGEDFTKSDSILVRFSSTFEIDSDNKELAVSLDGEKGPTLPLKLNVRPKAINVVVGNEN